MPGFNASGECTGIVPSGESRELGTEIDEVCEGCDITAGFVRGVVGPSGAKDELSGGI